MHQLSKVSEVPDAGTISEVAITKPGSSRHFDEKVRAISEKNW